MVGSSASVPMARAMGCLAMTATPVARSTATIQGSGSLHADDRRPTGRAFAGATATGDPKREVATAVTGFASAHAGFPLLPGCVIPHWSGTTPDIARSRPNPQQHTTSHRIGRQRTEAPAVRAAERVVPFD